MAYVDQWRLLHNDEFRGRVTVAALHAADAVLSEPTDHEGHDQRATLAYQVRAQNAPAIDALVVACATNPTIAAAEASAPGSSADADLDYVVASHWDAIAGA